MYGYIVWIALQAFPDTAEAIELQQWADIWTVTRVAASKATGTLTVTGTATTVIPAGTIWRSGAQQDYESDAEETIPAAGSVTVEITAVAAGADGNLAVGAKPNLVSPITGVVSEAIVATALTGGADIESDTSLLARLLLRLRNPPRGGTKPDYEFWSLSGHADVTRAWAFPLASGLGTVSVYFMTDDAATDGIPDAATVTAVNIYIQARKPVTADVTVAAPTAVPLDITINNVEPMTQAVQDAIEAELQDLITREADVGGTIQDKDGNDVTIGTLPLSHIREAISTAAGETDHTLTAPTADVTVGDGEITTLGTLTFTTS